MIDIELLRADQAKVAANLKRRGVPATAIDTLAALDAEWRELTEQVEQLRSTNNTAQTAVAQAAGAAKQKMIAELRGQTAEEKALTAQQKELEGKRQQAWLALPNLVADDVPDGDAADSEVVRESQRTPNTPPPTHDYFALAEPHLADFKRAAKVSGGRFVYLKGELARLELALASYAFDELARAGFTPVIPPVLIGPAAMSGMGYLGHSGDEIYRTQDDLYLVGTSEQALGPMHMNETLPAGQLPLRYVAFSTCFRREAGSHGRDVRGMMRLHQFDKVEMFSFSTPEQSVDEHEFLLEQQIKLVEALELPYRVVKLAAGDLGAPSAKTYDIETWIPSEGTWRETHSTSNTTDYQARRLNIRVKNAKGEVSKAHLLNGTAYAMSRILIALLENHQQPDGSVSIPAALHNYLPFTTIPAK